MMLTLNELIEKVKPKISVIIPVYKVEEYFERCVCSLVRQTYENIEIILVDDGSPDNCPTLCDKYAEEDARIKVIHKINGGLSDARNAGIREASGEYILFVDSDDYIDLDACEKFIQVIGDNKPDIVVGNARRIEIDGRVSLIQHKIETNGFMVSGKYYLKKELAIETMIMAAWLNLYNRDFIKANGLEFKYGILHEDEQFTPRVFLKANYVIGTNILFYNYQIREGSITKSKDLTKNAENLIQTCKELEVIYNKVDDPELRKMLKDDLVNKFLNIFQVAGLYKRKYSYLVDKNFIKGKAYTKRNKLRVALFCTSKIVYYNINRMDKFVKRSLTNIGWKV